MFEKLKTELAPDVSEFRTQDGLLEQLHMYTMESVIKNYTDFQQLWNEARDATTDSEICGRITGGHFQMQLLLGKTILNTQIILAGHCIFQCCRRPIPYT